VSHCIILSVVLLLTASKAYILASALLIYAPYYTQFLPISESVFLLLLAVYLHFITQADWHNYSNYI
jgi:hypothetical protein